MQKTKQIGTLGYEMCTLQMLVQTIWLMESYQWKLFVLSLLK